MDEQQMRELAKLMDTDPDICTYVVLNTTAEQLMMLAGYSFKKEHSSARVLVFAKWFNRIRRNPADTEAAP